jgi:hypothetical protein
MTGFGFDRMYTFIYHKDMEEADRFYGGLLGLEMEPESDWVNLYRVSEGMTIGVVQDGRGFLRATDDKPVMTSGRSTDASRRTGSRCSPTRWSSGRRRGGSSSARTPRATLLR